MIISIKIMNFKTNAPLWMHLRLKMIFKLLKKNYQIISHQIIALLVYKIYQLSKINKKSINK